MGDDEEGSDHGEHIREMKAKWAYKEGLRESDEYDKAGKEAWADAMEKADEKDLAAEEGESRVGLGVGLG